MLPCPSSQRLVCRCPTPGKSIHQKREASYFLRSTLEMTSSCQHWFSMDFALNVEKPLLFLFLRSWLRNFSSVSGESLTSKRLPSMMRSLPSPGKCAFRKAEASSANRYFSAFWMKWLAYSSESGLTVNAISFMVLLLNTQNSAFFRRKLFQDFLSLFLFTLFFGRDVYTAK